MNCEHKNEHRRQFVLRDGTIKELCSECRMFRIWTVVGSDESFKPKWEEGQWQKGKPRV